MVVCDNCLDAEPTPAHIFDCLAILATLQEIGVLFSSTNFYVDNVEQSTRTVIWANELISICFIEYTFNTGSVARCAESSDIHEIVDSGKAVYLLPITLTEYPPISQS
ncbi:hypothetical protein TNCV_4167241 [Trichonephila clavipes]|nr:hypothetical protein TNCV_4167241 [Trichonephila clavipes]